MVEKSAISEQQKIISIVNDINMYLKLLEQRIVKVELEIKSFSEKLERLERKLEESEDFFKKEVEYIKTSISNITLELERTKLDIKKKADLSELREIKELLDLFNPLKSVFVTKEEVKRMIREIINTNKQ